MPAKQNININFAQGLDQKTDPWQVPFGKFLSLKNTVFTKGGLLQKRNGFAELPNISGTAAYLTTFNGNLTAVGNNIQAYASGSRTWTTKGNIKPITPSVIPSVRSALNQTQCDSVVASNNLMCTVYTEVNNGTSSYKFQVQDVNTGQNIVAPTTIQSLVGSGTVTGSPRVFLLGAYFIVVFTNNISGTYHLQFVAISIDNPSSITASADLASQVTTPVSTVSWDGAVSGNQLFVAYNTTSGGQKVGIVSLHSNLSLSSPVNFAGSIATMMSVCVDTTTVNNVIYAAFYDSGSTSGYVVAINTLSQTLMTATQIISSGTVYNITCAAQSGVVTVAYEVANQYSYDSALPSNFLKKVSVTLPNTVTTGTAGSTTTFIRSVGLASKAFLMNSTMYMLTEYASSLQSTYFLIDISGNVVGRFAYENGGASLVASNGYLPLGLPQAQVSGSTVYIAYLFKDLINSTNTSGLTQSIGPAGLSNIYSQSGVNLLSLTFGFDTLSSAEIGSNLNLTGGMLWAYDGQTINEQGFHVFPDNIEASWSSTGGSIVAKPDGSTNTNAYYYQVLYEWTDSQGNIFRSAPSVPVGVTTVGGGTTGSITVNIPYLRLTYKSGVKIIIYRWSVANQVYYQVTSLTAPTLNSTTSDSLAYVDTLADASIVGNSIIYTTGGVLENTAGPACIAVTLFDNRLWLINAEDQNLLSYSKQVIEGVPVEMSDLLTFFVGPSTGAQGSTGPMKCLFPMDDKLIIFKKDAIYYINGNGPDNTGANSTYSQPIFVTSSVGSILQNSIAMTPNGLMFESDKGIWLLGRDLSTKYIGAPVENFNGSTVQSAVNVPGTTQIRFTLDSGPFLMYDYFFDQWGEFVGINAVSSCIFQGLHTFINSSGAVFQESPGSYIDGSNPVLISFTTSWFSMAGLQGYQRAFFFFLLGRYLSPHKISLMIGYDYNDGPQQSVLITPQDMGPLYGGSSPYGQQGVYGSQGANLAGLPLNWRVFIDKQRCESFQITLNEVFDPSLGIPPGAGLTLSGINLVYSVNKGWKTISAAQSAG